ncbi:hypothetical protein GCM10007111_38650 [Virgibacillus kapii]|uniref:Uncharacterized protein n=1 Tax=Virgibacillus kapii TaxID=1638645 RepID=A0ABQ2DVJ3_9BACI|nr:hypothetical protein GCM10007111_38650 [Virgibacillus kapii]
MIKPKTKYPIAVIHPLNKTYGAWVITCVIASIPEPDADNTVVSPYGQAWLPKAPA